MNFSSESKLMNFILITFDASKFNNNHTNKNG
jgi:hypothetical protein